MKEKLKKIRYPMLAVWGVVLGAAGTAGVKSSWHVIPKWIIGVIATLGIVVITVWMISGRRESQ